jgi:tetratricopeptide (TPR) repeat protein
MTGPLFDLGKWDEVLGLADEVTKWSRSNGEDYFAVLADSIKARVLVMRGKVAEAADLMAEILTPAREIADPQVLVPVLAAAASIEHSLGNAAQALRHVSDLADATNEAVWHRAVHLPELVHVAVAGKDISLGERLVDGIDMAPRRHQLCVLTSRAMLEEGRGNLEQAAELYREALEGWRGYGFALELGRALLGSGRCLLALGRNDPRKQLQEARRTFEELRAAPLVDEADQQLRRIPARTSAVRG